MVVAPLSASIDAGKLPQGSDVFGPLPRVLAAVGSGVAALVIVGGAVWSAVRLARRRSTRRLALANVLIAIGTLVLGAGGILNSVLDEMDGFAISLVVGISVIFAGFLLTNAPRAAHDAAWSTPHEGRDRAGRSAVLRRRRRGPRA